MEVRFKPETELRLHELASESGRPTDELVEDAMAGYLAEVSKLRGTLDGRYDEIQSGSVKPIDGERFFESLRHREDELLKKQSPEMNADQGFKLHPGAAHDITEIWEFIAQDNLLAAKRVREEILDAIRRLAPFPHQGHMRTDLTSRPLRFQIVHD